MATRRDFTTSSFALGLAAIAMATQARAATDSVRYASSPTPLRLPVWIDGRGPLSFIVDTGASRSVLASHALPELPRSTRREQQVRLQTPTGVLDVPTVEIATLATHAAADSVVPADALAATGPRRLPVLPRRALVSADGLVGADLLAGKRLRLDFVAGTATLSPASAARESPSSPPSPRRLAAARQAKVAVEFDAVGRPFVEVVLGRRRVRALLDTGALRSIADPMLQLDFTTDAATAGPAPESTVTGLRGADGRALQAVEGALPALRVGPRRWPPGPALFAPLPAAALTAVGGEAGKTVATLLVLGLDRLAALEWLELDYAAARLMLSPLRAGRG